MGPVEQAINTNVGKIQGVPITRESLIALAVLANQQILARALDRIGRRIADSDRSDWNDEDFSS